MRPRNDEGVNPKTKRKARWQSGYAADCKSVDLGSTPGRASMQHRNATLAQLVERNLAKVEVTSSNLVCRSKFSLEIQAGGYQPKMINRTRDGAAR